MLHLTALTEEDLQAVHQATLRILGEVGILLQNKAARQRVLEAGGSEKNGRVVLPPELVEWALSQCPGQVKTRGRDGKTMVLGDGALHWHNLGGARDVYDPESSLCRKATIQDVRDSARLLDALPAATSITPFFTPQDVPGELMSLAMYRHTLPMTTKPVQGPGVNSAAEVRFTVRMASVIGPPAEVLTLGISPVSPLLFPDDMAAAVVETAAAGIPLTPLPCPTAGATAPLSLAGSLAQQNAEVLATIVLAQLVHPGLPVVYCGRLAMMEPRTGSSVWGGVELGLASAATVQIARRYHLPVNVYGLSTNAHTFDIQSGYERALNAILPALAGADELSGIGEMQAGVAGSLAQMVIDNELAASVNRLRRGFRVDPDSLAVDVIAEALQETGNFLSHQHTVRYLRGGEILLTRLAERSPWEEWLKKGQPSMGEKAGAEAARLLQSHVSTPLEPQQERELDAILQAAASELVNS